MCMKEVKVRGKKSKIEKGMKGGREEKERE